MSFAREKRLLLGALAFLAPLPLPFNEALGWPFLIAYLVGVVAFLYRAARDRPRWLSLLGMNLLGLAYLPLFVFDLVVLSGGNLVGPVVRLGLFALLVKLFSLERERDKWQALMGIFFLFLAAMATSVHPSVVLYLLIFMGLAALLLARFAFFHLLAGFGGHGTSGKVPFRGLLTAMVLLAAVLAVPLFALLPRVRTPYLVAGSGGGGPETETTGFSDEVTLDSIGRVRTSREVALRIRYEDEPPGNTDQVRLKAATFDRYTEGRWVRTPPFETFPFQESGRTFVLADEPVVQWAEVWLRPLRSKSLVLPLETVRLEGTFPFVRIGRGGAVSLRVPPGDVLLYRVGLAEEATSLALPPGGGGRGEAPEAGPLDLSGVTPEMTELAAEVMGEGGSAALRARRLEQHFMREYEYTLDFVGRGSEEPLADFLFRYRSGHCEYFATAMVLMLRSQGIPARLVTGFLGAEHNPFENYYIVRQSNAHAWVEAYAAEAGEWRVYDPTPPAGRPTGGEPSVWSLLTQGYDYLLFRWDRYVLSYDFEDQIRFFSGLRTAWLRLTRLFDDEEKTAGPEPASEEAGEAMSADGPLPETTSPWRWVLTALLFAVAAMVALLLYARMRAPRTATGAYRRLRRQLPRFGLTVSDADPPLAVRHSAVARFPAAAAPAERLFELYLTESFAGRELTPTEIEEAERSLAETLRAMRKAG